MTHTINWTAFIQQAGACVASRYFSLNKLVECIRCINPQAPLSLWHRFLAWCGFFTFASMRRRALLPLFSAVTKAHFVGAPKEALPAYEKLVRMMLPQEASRLIAALSPTKLVKDVRATTAVKQEASPALFMESMRGILPELYQQYVEAFVKSPDAQALLEQQKREVMWLQEQIKEGFASLKKRAIPFYEELFLASLSFYKDLPAEIDALMQPTIQEALIATPVLTHEVAQEVLEKVRALIERRFQEAKKVIDRGKERNRRLQEIASFVERHQKELASLARYKECIDEYKRQCAAMNTLNLPKRQILEMESQTIEKRLEELYQRYQAAQQHAPEQIAALTKQCLDAERRCKMSKLRITRRLCEFFSERTPYPDLAETLASCRALLLEKIEQLDEKFYGAEISSSEHELLVNQLAYEHDVMLVRNELAFRSTRLREVRTELFRLLAEMQQARRLLSLVGGASEGIVYKEVVAIIGRIEKLLHFVEDPFRAFEGCFDGEQVSRKFRSLWLEIEEMQQTAHITARVHEYLVAPVAILKERFLKVCDDIEEVEKITGSRPDLVVPYTQQLARAAQTPLTALLTLVREVEKQFSFARPLAFFMAIDDFRVRQKLLREAKDLVKRVEELSSFAKAVQQIKTFEEERIDDILDFFERKQVIEEESSKEEALLLAWEKCCHRMAQAESIVEEELLFDIGFIDRKGLMDVEPMHEELLQKILRDAAQRARKRALQPVVGFVDRIDKLPEETATAISDWLAHPIADWKEDLEQFCSYLLLIKGQKETQLATFYPFFYLPGCLIIR